MENTSLEKISEIIKSNASFSIYSHIHTDIDAIGSCLALKLVLKKMGKVAHIFIDSEFPRNASTLKEYNLINNEKQKEYDVCFVLDCQNENRLGRNKYKYRKNSKTTIQIDHHIFNEGFCKYNFVKTDVSSTCEIIGMLVKVLKLPFDFDINKAIFSGILTDCGCLKYSNAYPSTLKSIAEMLENMKISMNEITFPLFNSLCKESFELKRLAYQRVEFFNEDKIAMIVLEGKDFKNIGASFDDSKGLCDVALQIDSVKIVVLVSESDKEPGVYYFSIRTKDNYDAQKIATEFGGGGHIMASGGKIIDSLQNAKTMLLEASVRELDRNAGVS